VDKDEARNSLQIKQ